MSLGNGFVAFSALIVLFSGATSVTRAQSHAEDASSAGPVFKTISIMQNRSGMPDQTTTIGPNELRATNETLAHLIQDAYQVDADQISAAPEWINNEHYDILAKVDSTGDGHLLQTVLSDRFNLAVHRETKLVPVYVWSRQTIPSCRSQSPQLKVLAFG